MEPISDTAEVVKNPRLPETTQVMGPRENSTLILLKEYSQTMTIMIYWCTQEQHIVQPSSEKLLLGIDGHEQWEPQLDNVQSERLWSILH